MTDTLSREEQACALLREWLETELDSMDEEFEPWIESFTNRIHTVLALRSLDAGAVREAVWLIERGQEHGQQPALWWVQNEDRPGHPYSGRWTEDANKARKFATRDLAEREGQRYVGHLYGVTEHVFLSAIDRSKINAAPQPSTANMITAPSTEGVGQGEVAGAAPDVRESRKATLSEALEVMRARLSEHLSPAEKRELEQAAALLAQTAAAEEELLDIPSFLRKWPDEKPAAAGVSERWMPNPTDADIADPLFEAIWQVTKRWGVNAPEYYVGYCGMNGSHVLLILNAIRHSLAERADRVSVPRKRLQHWIEYWSGNRNDTAMHDALEHIINEVESVLAKGKV